MKRYIKYYVMFAVLLFSGCIKNDIPYPVRRAYITGIEFKGQKSVEIDNEKRQVHVVLEDTTNINNVIMTNFEITDGATVEPELPNLPMAIDLEEEVLYTLTTYQKYNWKIVTTQPVERSAKFEGQVGKASFYEREKSVLVYVTEEVYENKRKDITVESLILGPSNSTISPDPTTVKDFSTTQKFTVTKHGKSVEWSVDVLPASSRLITEDSPKVRAYYAVLAASVVVDATGEIGFEYKKAGDADFQKITGDAIHREGGELTTTIQTVPNTKYIYRVYLDKEVGEEISLTTDLAPEIPNIELKDWYKKGKTWYPCKESEYGDREEYKGFWNTGNSGVTLFKESNVYSLNLVESGSDGAYFETIGDVPLVGMAAGSLFIGNFITNIGSPIDSPRFGRAFVGRPEKLVGKYKYFPKTITVSNEAKYPEMVQYKGQADRCIFWMKLENWGNETTRPKTPEVIAEGEYKEYSTVDQYKNFEIVLNYKSETKPTHIVLVFSSSEFGDYYTGGIGTKLFIKDLNLVY